jgi:hypothetical protein
MSDHIQNPFWVQTPENIPAPEAKNLFVDIFTEFPHLEAPAHSFVVGPRGSGKSMMFRMMRPDCLMLRLGCVLSELPYLSIYVPIKSTRITTTEMQRLEDHPARYVFNEHLLCLYVAIAAFQELARSTINIPEGEMNVIREWIGSHVAQRLTYCGSADHDAEGLKTLAGISLSEVFSKLAEYLDQTYWSDADNLLRSLALQPDRLGKYAGPLFSYHGFLFPVLAGLRKLKFLPNKPIYLLLDDADNLNHAQTEIVNSWIATRSTEGVCLKLSDQMGYKTWLTYGGKRIQTPHDYNKVDISVLYTTQRDKYLQRIEDIVAKRLELAQIKTTPREFFPNDTEQEQRLHEIEEELKKRWEDGDGSGNRSRDDVTRYARPELIRRLGGASKSRSTYSYAGFEQLAHISSGVVRYFLEPAALMYAKQRTVANPIAQIAPRIQDDVIREFSNSFLEEDLVSMRRDAGISTADYEKLSNLIEVMGNSFADRLLDDKASERRVFSIALSDRPDDDVQRILDLGTKEGFFYRASLGAKRGSGRVPRYVLTRRLAPRFKLDPTSFAGYLFVTSQSLRAALTNPNHRLRETQSNADPQLELQMNAES